MISVFGATGFIGSNFCRMYPDEAIKIGKYKSDSYDYEKLYFISTTHNYNSLPDDVETNLLWLSEVLHCLTSSDTFNFISSWFIYPSNIVLPAKEWDILGYPRGNYSFTKRLAEEMVWWYCDREGIPWRIFRLANVFGKGDSYSKQKNALQYLVNEMRHNRDIELYCGGDFIRDYIYVDEVCRLLYEGMNKLPTNEVYNIGSGVPITFGDWISLAHQWLDSKSKIIAVEPSEFHKKVQVKDFYMDISKIAKYGLVPERYQFMLDHFKDVVLDENS